MRTKPSRTRPDCTNQEQAAHRDGAAQPPGNEADAAALVRSALAGEPAAMESLVGRHYDAVGAICRRLLWNADDAREAAQDVFVQVIRELDSLTDPHSLGAWIARIARHHCLALLRRRRHELLPWGWLDSGPGGPESPADSPAQQAQAAELRERVSARIEGLARIDAQVLRLHYLEHQGLRQIARLLGVAEGTIKWRLAQARMRLREDLMTDELTDQLRHRNTADPILDIKTNYGSGSPPVATMTPLLAQQILLCIHKQAKPAEQIAREVKADRPYVAQHLSAMLADEVVAEHDGQYRANCILLDRDDCRTIRQKLRQRGDRTADVIARHLPELTGAMSQTTPLRQQGMEEGVLRWVTLTLFVLNVGVSNELKRRKRLDVQPPRQPDGGRWWYVPRILDGGLPVELGCNSHDGKDGWAQYWNSEIGNRITRPSAAEMLVVHRLGKGPAEKGSLEDVFGAESVAGMVDRGLVQIKGNQVHTAVPVFWPADGDILDKPVTAVSEAIVDEVYADFPDDIFRLLDELGYSFIRRDYPAHAQGLAQLGAVEALTKRGILEVPQPPPPGWCFFAWHGVFAPMQRI